MIFMENTILVKVMTAKMRWGPKIMIEFWHDFDWVSSASRFVGTKYEVRLHFNQLFSKPNQMWFYHPNISNDICLNPIIENLLC